MHALLVRAFLAAAALTLAACGGQASPSESPATPATADRAASAATKVNIDEIFPPGPARDLLLNNCQSCHTFVPIVVLQMDREAWQRNSLDHRDRVTTLRDEEFKILYEYLAANFGPHRPVPRLPKELLDSWTSY